MTAKQQVAKILEQLPESCTIEDVQYQLYVAEIVRRRIEQANQGQLIPQAEAEKRLGKWLIK